MIKPRAVKQVVHIVDSYSELYKDLFAEVRAYEYFNDLLLRLISEIKRKSFDCLFSWSICGMIFATPLLRLTKENYPTVSFYSLRLNSLSDSDKIRFFKN